jgi:hypothetical protein
MKGALIKIPEIGWFVEYENREDSSSFLSIKYLVHGDSLSNPKLSTYWIEGREVEFELEVIKVNMWDNFSIIEGYHNFAHIIEDICDCGYMANEMNVCTGCGLPKKKEKPKSFTSDEEWLSYELGKHFDNVISFDWMVDNGDITKNLIGTLLNKTQTNTFNTWDDVHKEFYKQTGVENDPKEFIDWLMKNCNPPQLK